MARILISFVLPFVMPTVIYFLWTAWVRKKIMAQHAKDGDANADITADEVEAYEIRAPWLRLIIAGVVLMLVTLMLSVLISPKNPPGSVYQPPYEQNGKIVPGQYVPKPQ